MKRIILSVLLVICLISGVMIYINTKHSEVSIEFYNAVATDLLADEYAVGETPMFTEKDIDYFDWENQMIMFNDQSGLDVKAMDLGQHHMQTLSSFATSLHGKFYVFVDGEFIYSGYYAQAMISSFFADGLIMKDIDGGVVIEDSRVNNTDVDLRFDERLKNALKENGLLKE